MEAVVEQKLNITLEDEEEIQIFSSLIYKLKHSPEKVGFLKGDLKPEEEDIVNALYSLFTYPENEE